VRWGERLPLDKPARGRGIGSGPGRSFRPRGWRWSACAAVATLSSLALFLPRNAAGNDFSDFRIPSNRSLLWTAGLSGRSASQDYNQASSQSSAGDLNGVLSTRFRWLSDSDPAVTVLDIVLAAQGTSAHRTTQSQIVDPVASLSTADEENRQDVAERWSLGAGHRRYPWAMPLGFDLSAFLSGDYSQRWEFHDTGALTVSSLGTNEMTQHFNTQLWTYVNVVVARASTGWGRVRDATGIYDALVLERRLLETGALTRPLSPAGRQRLAEALYLRGSLDTVRERPGRVLWREIERVLAEDGALREGGLDPYSVLRAAEPHLGASGPLTADGIPISPVIRPAGYYASLQVFDQHLNILRRFDSGISSEQILDGTTSSYTTSSSSNRMNQKIDLVEAGPAIEFHAPLGAPWRIDGYGSASLALRKEDDYLRTASQLSLAWLAADRWTATGRASFYWFDDERTQGPAPGDSWSSEIGAGVSWYFEDHAAIELSASQVQQWFRGVDDAASPGPVHTFVRSLSASLGVTYRFAGWFAAPGFFPATPAPSPAR
jgi:hypothetical protein